MIDRAQTVSPILTAFVAVLAGFLAGPSSSDAQMPSHPFQPGTPFPTLALPSLDDGRPTSVADFRGQKVILHVFASW